MCGILGRFARFDDPLDPALLIRATNMLAHRGPDDGAWWSEGPFFLGFRRLAIIDLQSGAQPMATADGRFVIVFNGEIYNYIELREELRARGATFHTTSDTEVILHGYQAWGTRLPEKLVGMFALAIVDRVEQTLYLARDRFGEKPLFFRETSGEVMFASEADAAGGAGGHGISHRSACAGRVSVPELRPRAANAPGGHPAPAAGELGALHAARC